MDSFDCNLNPALETCTFFEPKKIVLVNENHLDPILLHKESGILGDDDDKGEENELEASLKSPLSRDPKTALPVPLSKSPLSDPLLSVPSPVAGGVICSPGSGHQSDPRCQQLVQVIKPIASDCSRNPSDPSCSVSPPSEGCQDGSLCDRAEPQIENTPADLGSNSCTGGLGSTDGECGADEGNNRKITQSDTKCNSEICSPGPVPLSHDGLRTECDGDPLCQPVDSLIKEGQTDCLDDTDCIARKPECSHGSPDPRCQQEVVAIRDCPPDSTDPSCSPLSLHCTEEDEDCQLKPEKGKINLE